MDEELDRLAFRFFKIFAQCEYALKAQGYAKATRGNGVEPDWDRFSNEVGVRFFAIDDPELAKSISYMIEQPPKRQTLTDGLLSWQDVTGTEGSPQSLFASVRRVRNNLYHGGKFAERWFEPERSADLLGHSIVILTALSSIHPELQAAMTGLASESSGIAR